MEGILNTALRASLRCTTNAREDCRTRRGNGPNSPNLTSKEGNTQPEETVELHPGCTVSYRQLMRITHYTLAGSRERCDTRRVEEVSKGFVSPPADGRMRVIEA